MSARAAESEASPPTHFPSAQGVTGAPARGVAAARRVFPLPEAREWWRSLRWVFVILTLLMIAALLGSFVPYDLVLTEGHPWLPRRACAGCPFCGMTRSFCAMSAGRFRDALHWNRGGPVLYVGGWLWVAGFGSLVPRRICRHLFSKDQAAA